MSVKQTKVTAYRLIFMVMCFLFGGVLVAPLVAATGGGIIGSWTTNSTSLPAARSVAATATYNGYVYVMGGWNGSTGSNTVYHAPLNSDGTVGSWTTSSHSLPASIRVTTGVAYNGYIYVIGGLDNTPSRVSTIYHAPLNSDGTVGSWTTSANPLPQTMQATAAVAYNGYLYAIGGYNASALSTVYYAPLNSDGTVGSWTTNTTPLSFGRESTSAIVYNGRVYLFGGKDSSTSPISSVQYASVNADHSIGSWTSTTSLPTTTSLAGIIQANGYVYVMGGAQTNLANQSSVYYAQLKSDGTIGSWTTSPNSLPVSYDGASAVTYNNYAYYIGGMDSGLTPQTGVYHAALTAPTTSAQLSSAVTGKDIAIATATGTDLTCSNSTTEANLAQQDSAFTYPIGLVRFCFTTNATSNQVTTTFVTSLSPSQVQARYYNSSTGLYGAVSGATITPTSLNGQAALQLTYTITDNGPLDVDPTVGAIDDPVGLAMANVDTAAPATGIGTPTSSNPWIILGAYGTLSFGVATISVVLRKRSIKSSR